MQVEGRKNMLYSFWLSQEKREACCFLLSQGLSASLSRGPTPADEHCETAKPVSLSAWLISEI